DRQHPYLRRLAAEDRRVDEVRDRLAELARVLAGQRRDDARGRARARRVRSHDARVRVRAAQHRHVDRAGHDDVVDVGHPARHEAVAGLLLLAGADVRAAPGLEDRRHETPSSAPRRAVVCKSASMFPRAGRSQAAACRRLRCAPHGPSGRSILIAYPARSRTFRFSTSSCAISRRVFSCDSRPAVRSWWLVTSTTCSGWSANGGSCHTPRWICTATWPGTKKAWISSSAGSPSSSRASALATTCRKGTPPSGMNVWVRWWWRSRYRIS